MAKQYFSRRNLDFLLYEVHNAEELTQYPYFQDHSRETFDMVLDMNVDIADRILHPAFVDADRKQPNLVDGQVKVHPGVHQYIKAMGEAGLIAAPFSYEDGGQQLPEMVAGAAEFIRGAANNSFVMFTGLAAGSTHLILAFGSDELKQTYTPNMLSGKWGGTMCLTEPNAGSSLSDLETVAIPQPDGTYKIKGQKVFISAGDQDYAENIIHLVLARIQGAPKGTKGISLFVVPKKRLTADGGLVDNDVVSTGIYHKMGQKGTPAMHLTFGDRDDSIGYVVGQEHQGLKYMFQMMNEARLGVGMAGAYIASAAYYASLEYAQERPQGRRLNNKNLDDAPTFIVNHPDVRRLLMSQKALFEGSTSLILECHKWSDLTKVLEGDEKVNTQTLLDLMTTVAKTYPAESGIQAVNQGVQVLGGYGYTEDFPLEQMARDVRIMSIYEGTTAIHSLTLLGRGIPGQGGKAAQLLFGEVMKSIADAETFDDLKPYADKLKNEMGRLQKVTMHLLGIAAKGDHEVFLADASLYMEMFGTLCVAWQWIKQATVAKRAMVSKNVEGDELAFYEGKIHSMKFYFHYEVPKVLGLAARLTDTEVLTVVEESEYAFQ
jgi:alkylation response protein AidB-like acyl-CoA dehydrogenase